jgi:hypothetical protein
MSVINVWTPEGSVDAPRFAMASMFSRREYSVYVPPEGRSFTPYVWTLTSELPKGIYVPPVWRLDVKKILDTQCCISTPYI